MFCAPGLIFGGAKCVGSRFHVLRSRTRIRRYRVRRVPFSCFACPNSFSTVPRASGPVTCFVLPDSFSAVPRASGPVFMFCAPRLIFDGTEGTGSRIHLLRSQTHFQRYLECRVPFFMICAPRLVFGGTEGVGSHFHGLLSRNRFQLYRGRRVPFSCFVLPDSFSAVMNASGPVFKFCPSVLIFGGTEGVESLFLVLRAQTHFRRYRGRRVPFSCFALPESFSTVLRASGPVFMFCALGLVFGSTEGVRSHFLVLRAQTHFRQYRGRQVPFFSFVLQN
jgi:hypothetical protein